MSIADKVIQSSIDYSDSSGKAESPDNRQSAKSKNEY